MQIKLEIKKSEQVVCTGNLLKTLDQYYYNLKNIKVCTVDLKPRKTQSASTSYHLLATSLP